MAKALSRKVTIYVNGKEVQSTIQSLEGEMKKLQAQQKKMTIGTEEYIKTSMKIREINGVINEQKQAVKGLGNEWKSTATQLSEFGNMMSGLQSAFSMIDLGIGKLKDLAKDAAALDDVYADVMKTTGLTHEQVENLNAAFSKMDTRTSREQLNQLAYEAGKLGINSEKAVQGFVSAADKINIALGDVLGNGAMVTIGKLSDVYSKSTKQLADSAGDIESQMLKIGSAINMLGQSSTANEAYMVDFLGRLGGIATQAGLSADQILGFASALDQDMQKVEMAATAFQKLIQQMIKKPEEFVEAAKMPLEEFKQMLETDMNGAIQKVLAGFNDMGGLNALIPVFKDMGLDGARAASVVAAMASSLDKVAEAQRIANDELTTGNSVLNEFNTKNNTMQAQAEKAKKRFEDMRIELGNELYPVLIHLQRTGTVLMKGVAGFVQIIKENKAILPGLIALMTNWVRVKTMALIASGKLQASLKALLGINKLEAHQKDLLTAKELKLTAAKEAERLTTLKNQLAIERENLARQKSKVGMEAQALVQVAETRVKQLEVAVTNQSTVATNANTAAVKAQKAAFASTPWGLVITALTTIAALTYKVVTNSEKWKLNQTMKEVAKQTGEAEGKLKVLFDRLKDAAAGSEQYKKAVNELKAAYPDLIARHIDEEGKIKDLTAAYNDLAAAARQSVYDRMFQEEVSKRTGELGEILRKRINQVGKLVDKELKNTSTAQRDELKKNLNAILVDFSNGTRNFDNSFKEIGRLLEGAGFERGSSRWKDINLAFSTFSAAVSNTNRDLDALKANFNAQDADPFGVEKMSLAQLNSELEIALRQQAKYKRAVDQGHFEYADELDNETKKVKALQDQINKLNAAKNSTSTTTGGTTVGSTSDPKEAAKRAKEAEKEWENATKAGLKMITDFNLKAESGMAKIQDDIDQKTESMISRLRSAAEAAGKSSEEMEKKLTQAANNLKKVQLDAYMEKLTDAFDKLSEAVGDRDGGRLMTEGAKLGEAIVAIDKAMAAAEADLSVATGKHREELEDLIAQYKELKSSIWGEVALRAEEGNDLVSQARKMGKDAAKALQDAVNNVELEKTPFQKWCDENLDIVENFADKSLDIFSNINSILKNIGDQRLKDLETQKDQEIDTLDKQLEQGLISEETYNERKLELEKNYDEQAKEEQRKQFQREKLLSIAEASMASALAVVKVWAAEGPTSYKAAMSAILAAQLATQIAAIASQPEPYAKGGYVNSNTVYRAGEAGREWVASNRLLNDPVAGPTIEALEEYQRGNSRALGDIPMASLNMPVAMAAARELGSRATGTLTSSVSAGKGDDMLSVMKQLAAYLKDPKNRQAIISRQTMTDFDTNEQFLRNRATL